MSYHRDRWQGVGAIAAAAPAPRSAPAPMIQPRMPRLGGMPGPLGMINQPGAIDPRSRCTSVRADGTCLAIPGLRPPTLSGGVSGARPPTGQIGQFRPVNQLVQIGGGIATVGGTAFVPGTSAMTRPTVLGGGQPPRRPPAQTSSSQQTFTPPLPLPAYQPPTAASSTSSGTASAKASGSGALTTKIGSSGQTDVSPVLDDLPLDEQFAPPAPAPAPKSNTKLLIGVGLGAVALYFLMKKR